MGTAQAPQDSGSTAVVQPAECSISRSKRILEYVDTYVLRPDRLNRTALRIALLNEFDGARAQGQGDFDDKDIEILCAALSNYGTKKSTPTESVDRAVRLTRLLRQARG